MKAKGIDPGRAGLLIRRSMEKNGDFFKMFGALDDQWERIYGAAKKIQAGAGSTASLLRKVKQLGTMLDKVHGELRDKGRLGPWIYSGPKMPKMFINARTIIKRIPLDKSSWEKDLGL